MRRALLSIALLLPLTAAAQMRPSRAPQVVRTMSRAVLSLDGRVVRYEITEKFVNRGGTPGETDYLLPLPPRAAFEDLALSIDGEMVTGETMHADKARAIYEEIVRRQRDPALVEWMGQGLMRTRIFPIAPGEEKTVVVRFRAVVEREGDALRIDYRPSTRTGDDEARSTFELRYPANGDYGRAFSPTHDLQNGDHGSLRTARVERVRGVVTTLVPLRGANRATVHVLTHATDNEDGYAMITIAPPPASRTATPRDITFVMDVSGSMSGSKLEQARNAGDALLGALAPSDRFRIIAFSSDVRSFRDEWTAANTANVRAGQAFLRGLRAEGSTNISAALESALQAGAGNGRLPLTLFLTDGAPTVGERNPDRIAALADRLRGRQRVFTFGVGADVNAALLEQLALSGRGTAQFVRPEEDVERAVSVVAQRLANPVATDLRVLVDGVRLDRVQPHGTFDLFAGQEVTLFARYRSGRRAARVTVEGTSVDGPVRWMTTADFPGRADENAFVARLWAVQRVGWLSAERRRTGATTELDDELRALGMRFGIPTELTSYLVVEPGMQRNAMPVGGVAQPGTLMNAPAPAMAARAAFERAKAAADQRAVRSIEQLDAATGERRDATRFVLGRIFTFTDGVWQDTPTTPPTRTVKVVAYSAAYFALLQRVPALADVFALGERVAVQGKVVRLVLDASGDTTLSVGALDAIVRDW